MSTKYDLTTQALSGDPAQLPAFALPRRSLYELLNSPAMLAEIEKSARGLMTGKFLVATLFQCASKSPDLLQCSPQSLVSALKTLAAMQCEPDGINGYLVPFKCKGQMSCTPIPSARGLMRMARANGVRNLNAGVVREGDLFCWCIREGRFSFSHEVSGWGASRPVMGVFCAWEDKEGFLHGVRMGKDEVDCVRNRSRAGCYGPWVDHWEQMALKTVIKRAAKQWDLPHEAHLAMMDADEGEFRVRGLRGLRGVAVRVTGGPINPFSDAPMPEEVPAVSSEPVSAPVPVVDPGFMAGVRDFGGEDALPGLDVPPADDVPRNREDF